MSHLFVVQLDIPAEHEAEFNRVYDTEHFPSLMKVPGVLNGARYRLEHSTVPGMQRYLTIYEIESPAVLASQAWEKAGAFGDWIEKIRPKLPPAITAYSNGSPDRPDPDRGPCHSAWRRAASGAAATPGAALTSSRPDCHAPGCAVFCRFAACPPSLWLAAVRRRRVRPPIPRHPVPIVPPALSKTRAT